MTASDARIAAREDEYADYLECLRLAAEAEAEQQADPRWCYCCDGPYAGLDH
jgi:hypothetical protein